MFKFKEELAKYRESLEARDLAGGVSGDEVRDVLDIAKELASARAFFEPPKAAEPMTREEEAAMEETENGDEAAKAEAPETADDGREPAGKGDEA